MSEVQIPSGTFTAKTEGLTCVLAYGEVQISTEATETRWFPAFAAEGAINPIRCASDDGKFGVPTFLSKDDAAEFLINNGYTRLDDDIFQFPDEVTFVDGPTLN